LQEMQLTLLPNDTWNRLLHKWLEGLMMDPHIMPLVMKQLSDLKKHRKDSAS